MRESEKSAWPDGPDLEDIKRFVLQIRPESMGMMELVLIDAWLSEALQSSIGRSENPGDLKYLKSELEKRLRYFVNSSG